VERRHLAAGASGRNAGFLLEGTAANYAAATREHGRALAREVWEFTAENHALLAEALAGRAGYRRSGSATVAASPAESLELAEAAELMADDAFPASWSPGRLLNPRDGELDPAAAVAALAVGGRIIEDCEVLGFADDAVTTNRGEVRVDHLILATNAYTSQLLPEVAIRPVRAQMLATAAVPPFSDRPAYSDYGYRYWRQAPGGEVLVGGFRNQALEEEVGFVEAPSERIQELLENHARELDVAAPVTHRWAGIMGFTPDSLPLVGAVPGRPGVYICGGYTGHGMGFAVNCARRLAEHLTGGPPPPAWMNPARVWPL
jgi:gamma-glutamylputrescine oxidase